MASHKFTSNLEKHLAKNLKKVLAGPFDMKSVGSSYQQSAKRVLSSGVNFMGANVQSYGFGQAILLTIPTIDVNFGQMFCTVPVLNTNRESVQGVATFLAVAKAPVDQTYIEKRTSAFSHKLIPLELFANGHKPKDIIKHKMVKSQAVNFLNLDKKFCKRMVGSDKLTIPGGWMDDSSYKLNFDYENYFPGYLTLIPYHGFTLMIARDAGSNPQIDRPRYDFNRWYQVFSTAAHYIKTFPQVGEPCGIIFPEQGSIVMLSRLLPQMERLIDRQAPVAPPLLEPEGPPMVPPPEPPSTNISPDLALSRTSTKRIKKVKKVKKVKKRSKE